MVGLLPPEQVEVGWQVPKTPSAVQVPYVQHWILDPPPQCPASDLPPRLEQVDVSMHSPASSLSILQVWAKLQWVATGTKGHIRFGKAF